MRPLYEAHITFNHQVREWVERHHSQKWKFSAIDGDPVLGDRVYCYLTSYDEDQWNLLSRMQDEVSNVSAFIPSEVYWDHGAPVRLKIERIVYDTKTNRDEVTGAAEVG